MRKRQHTPAAAAVGIEHAIRMLEGRWKLVILFHLFGGRTLRFSDLERAIPAISQKMLIQQLRQLERDGTSRAFASLSNGHSASRSRTRKPVGGFEPRGELSIDVRRLLEAYLEVPTVGGRLLPLLNARAPDVGSGFQREDE